MSKHHDLDTGQRLPEHILDALMEFIGSQASPTFKITQVNATTIEVVAAVGNGQVAIAIDGKWRYRTTTVQAAVPGTPGAGTYNIFVTASANSFTDIPDLDTDNTDYNFGLEIRTSGNPATAHYRLVGTITWSGSAITGITQAVGAYGYLAPGVIGAAQIAADAIDATKIAANAVGSSEIANDAVGSTEIANDAVGSTEIANGAVGNTELATDAVDASKIAVDAVGSSEIAAGAVGTSELGALAVDSTKLAGGAVTSAKIAPDAVDAAALAANSVDTAAIQDGAVTSAKLAGGAPQGVPAGCMLDFCGNEAQIPSGYLICAGQQANRTTFAALFAAIGILWGPGDGVNTFNVPDFRGRVALGKDNMNGSSANRLTDTQADNIGQGSGAETITLVEAQMPVHTHIQTAHNHIQDAHNHTQNSHNHGPGSYQAALQVLTNTTATGSSDRATGNSGGNNSPITGNSGSTTAVNDPATATNQSATAVNQNAGSGSAHGNVQPYGTVNKIIKT